MPQLAHRLLSAYARWLKGRHPSKRIPADVQRLCIFSMSGDGLRAGDRVATATVLHLIARRFPGAELSLITTRYQAERYGELYTRHLGIHRVIGCDIPGRGAWRQWLTLRRLLRKERFDVCVQDSRDDILNPFFAHLCGIQTRLGLHRGLVTDRFLDPDWNVPAQPLGTATLLDIAVSYGQALGFDPPLRREQIEPFFQLASPSEPAAAGTRRPLVILHPGGARDWNRRWPHYRYIQLCSELIDDCNPHIVIIGGAEEREDAELIVQQVLQRHPGATIDNRCGGDLNRIGAYLSVADLLVANDSSVMHIAAGLGTPAVIVFGPSYHGVWDAYRKQTSALSGFHCWRQRPTIGTDVTAKCGHHCPVQYDPAVKRYPLCLVQLRVATVIDACKRILDDAGWSTPPRSASYDSCSRLESTGAAQDDRRSD